jgi:hypothetical protein
VESDAATMEDFVGNIGSLGSVDGFERFGVDRWRL